MRRAATIVLAATLAVAAVVGVVAFFAGRDEGTTAQRPAVGDVDPAARDRLLRTGNVQLTYGSAADEPRLRALVDTLGAGDSPALQAAGQAVILRRLAGRSGVLARAWRHSLRVASPEDPRLQDFVARWLGAPASG